MKAIFFSITLLAALQCSASGLEGLEAFVKHARNGQAQFTQVVTAPAKEGQSAARKTSTGTFAFLRPGRFKFVYEKPFAQTIVADGQTLWVYDVDLNQVSTRGQAAALGSTPAALIASATDLNALKADFHLRAVPDRDGLQWVLATPKDNDSALQSVHVGMKGKELAALEIVDNFGQRSVMRFTAMQINSGIDASAFVFKPPATADIVRQ